MKGYVGIAGLGVYLPSQIMTAAELARQAALAEEVIRERMGLLEKRISGQEEHVSNMATEAGKRALEDAAQRLGNPIHPEDLDGIIYFGSPHKDYYVWQVAPRIQHLLGARKAWAFEVAAVSAGAPVALRVAADMMSADPSLRRVLLVAASKESMLLNYQNQRARFMFNFGDGAVAALLVRDLEENVILSSAFHTDGSFAEEVRVPAGGSKHPPSPQTVAQGLHFFDVRDPLAMKERLDPISRECFVRVARTAVCKSWHDPGEIEFLAVLHVKRSLYEGILQDLGLTKAQSIYLERYGHISAADPILALWEGERQGRLRPGMLVVTLSAGTGYTWAATTIAWGKRGSDAADSSH